ncbi:MULTISPECIES: hypothetical protein [Pseudomonas]|jgi:hypothetical protein|uniref:hypothetical protein n=1 Tax=Pseudomonas TaxID=286 RepID=UPI0006805FAE|nr:MULTISPECIES: hypothetical protein [Pseudomonas]KNH43682.1 hypothetical protein ACS73_24575 [Pseudomonas lini]POA78641.1 hypothetical protein C1890_09910 [Pseudomonas sp. DP16D-R1]
MSDEDLRELKRQMVAQVKHQTRWLRRAPMLIGVVGGGLALLGLWQAAGSLITLGALCGVTGFGAQAVLWYSLHDEEKP